MMKIKIVRSRRRTIAVEVKSDGRVIVRVTQRMNDKKIQRFVEEKRSWIEKHVEIVKERKPMQLPLFSKEEINQLADASLKDLPLRVSKYAAQMGVTVNHVIIRNQKTR